MYGKSQQLEGGHVANGRMSSVSSESDVGVTTKISVCEDDSQDPSVHPWGVLIATREGILTLLDCFLEAKSLKALQNVFNGARVRERERELLYPDACGGCGQGWIGQGAANYGRGHGTRESCALHTASFVCKKVFNGARVRERERELLYPDICGGGGRGWISQGAANYGRGHGTRESCALHTASFVCKKVFGEYPSDRC
ncbi:hypothetical protein IFM89_008656 [Coptis chinensis]|uniref:Uncharacterized protein n=1 Tax=Coptis chinensis TaxID=261450 RepID=A0A835GWL6_9MAGN|nr:hypothetical protein IFM89_008656 [Coptis chinensis]